MATNANGVMMTKATEKIKVKSCRFCVLASEKSCNYDNDIFIADNIDDDSINESKKMMER
jgi:hypothetical protein